MTSPERVLIHLKIFRGPFSFDRNVMRSCCAFKCHTRACFEWSTYSWVPMYVWLNQITQIAGLKKNCSVSRQYTRNVKITSQIGFWQSAISFFTIPASPTCTSVPTGCNFQQSSCSLGNGCNILQFLDFTNSFIWQARARQYDNLLQQSTYRERSSSFTTEEICQMLKAARINLLIRQVSMDARYLRVFLHQDCSHSHVLNGVRLLLSTIVCLIKLQE